MKVTIIGLGLIGGSIAMDLRKAGVATTLTGVDQIAENAETAITLGLVDKVESLENALPTADLVVLAIPVNALAQLLPSVLDSISPQAVVIDAGSTKGLICRAVTGHSRRSQFVAAHPIAGTENSGPTAALTGLFRNKTNIICERERSSEAALAIALTSIRSAGVEYHLYGARGARQARGLCIASFARELVPAGADRAGYRERREEYIRPCG